MVRIAHYLAGLVGVAIIGCVAHMNVMGSGGYDSTSAPMMLALACGLAIGSIAVGIAWGHRRWAIALLLVGALLAGEGYALLLTAERTLAHRDVQQAPLRAAAKARAKAIARLENAESKLLLSGNTPRLGQALAAKSAADQAVITKAAERGCASNCRKLLEQQVQTAEREVSLARTELSLKTQAAEREVTEARAALDALPVLGSASPLADRLGVADWKVDLIASALASIAANGLAALLIAFAAHGRAVQPIRVIKAEVVPPKRREKRDAAKEADLFARNVFRPQPEGRVSLREIRTAYHGWCADRGAEPLPDQQIGAALNDLFAKVGLDVAHDGGEAAVTGIEPVQDFCALIQAAPLTLRVAVDNSPTRPTKRLGRMAKIAQSGAA